MNSTMRFGGDGARAAEPSAPAGATACCCCPFAAAASAALPAGCSPGCFASFPLPQPPSAAATAAEAATAAASPAPRAAAPLRPTARAGRCWRCRAAAGRLAAQSSADTASTAPSGNGLLLFSGASSQPSPPRPPLPLLPLSPPPLQPPLPGPPPVAVLALRGRILCGTLLLRAPWLVTGLHTEEGLGFSASGRHSVQTLGRSGPDTHCARPRTPNDVRGRKNAEPVVPNSGPTILKCACAFFPLYGMGRCF